MHPAAILFSLLSGLHLSTSPTDLPAIDSACRPQEVQMDRWRTYRSMSLDLTGNVPQPQRYARLQNTRSVPDAFVEELLNTEAFTARVVRWHRDLLWNNVDNVELLSNRAHLRRTGEIHFVGGTQARLYRGAAVVCADTPASYNEDGSLQTERVGNADVEGYVMVAPYWDPANPIKVCAFDAQERALSADGADCGSTAGFPKTDCGCGPDLRWCATATVREQVIAAMGKEVEHRVAHIIGNDLPYSELFLSNIGFVNGPLVHYWKHWPLLSGGIRNNPVPLAPDTLPTLPFSATDTWQEMTLPPSHAGVLTSPAFLLRFQTNRGRASQFYTKFLCSPFEPPAVLPLSDEATLEQPDLQQRDGCKYCHAIIEPTAAFWGRWPQSGAGYLNETDFPDHDPTCYECATTSARCNNHCKTYYQTKSLHPDEEAYLGDLQALLFIRPEQRLHVAQGPQLLALQELETGRLSECAVRTALERLLGRTVTPEEEPWLDSLQSLFVQTGYDYKALIKAIITSETYRRVR